ncbi:MAG: hypothetical protein ACREMG_15015, partial [Gemmatimonadales bacterium]
PAERTAISERPTRDIQAFLLYSRGLEAQDRGDFAGAAQAFQAAVQRDPSFSAAGQAAASNQAAQAADAAPATDVAVAASGGAPSEAPPTPSAGTLLNAINSAVPSGTSTIDVVSTTSTIATIPTNPNPPGEGGGFNNPTPPLIGTIIIIIKRP